MGNEASQSASHIMPPNWEIPSQQKIPVPETPIELGIIMHPTHLAVAITLQPQSSLESREAEALKRYIEYKYSRIITVSTTEFPPIRITREICIKNGTLQVWCLNMTTVAWLAKCIEYFHVRLTNHLVIKRQETGPILVHSLLFIPDFTENDLKPVISALKLRNGNYNFDSWSMYSAIQVKDQQKGTCLSLGIPVNEVEKIMAEERKVIYNEETLHVSFYVNDKVANRPPPIEYYQYRNVAEIPTPSEDLIPPVANPPPRIPTNNITQITQGYAIALLELPNHLKVAICLQPFSDITLAESRVIKEVVANEISLSAELANGPPPKFLHQPIYDQGVVYFWCGNDITLQWLIHRVTNITLVGRQSQALTVVKVEDLPNAAQVAIFLPEYKEQELMSLYRVLKFQNPNYVLERWNIHYSVQTQGKVNGTFVILLVPLSEVQNLMLNDCKVYFQTQHIYARFVVNGRIQERPPSTSAASPQIRSRNRAEESRHLMNLIAEYMDFNRKQFH